MQLFPKTPPRPRLILATVPRLPLWTLLLGGFFLFSPSAILAQSNAISWKFSTGTNASVAINAQADGTFSAIVALAGATNIDEIEAQIQTLDGTNIGEAFHSSPASATNTLQLKAHVDSPKLWTAETPNLYRAEFRLKWDGKVIEQVTQRFGFRTSEVRTNGLYLNGQHIILKAAAGGLFRPDSTSSNSEAAHRPEINAMKDANLNAVRMSPYLLDEQFLNLCDELGLYVLDDVSDGRDHPDAMNHPSILFGYGGNGSGSDTNLDKLFDEADIPTLDDILEPNRQNKGSFYTIKEIWSPIQIKRGKKGMLTLENHFSFTDASECKFEWELRKFPLPTENKTEQVLASGMINDVPQIGPGQTGTFKFIPPPNRNADALALRVSDPLGRELWTWVWQLRSDPSHRLSEEPAEHNAIPSETNGTVVVTTGDMSATFSQQTGLLLGVQRGAQKFSLTNGPCVAVGSATLREMHYTDDGPDSVVVANFDGDLKRILWRVNGNGWIQCTYTYLAHGTNDFLGVTFDYPENLVTHKRWYGDGPYRVWKNRLRGVTQGVWENDGSDTPVGWRGPEFKGFFANWHWLQLSTHEGPITVINQGDTKFLQVLTPGFMSTNLMGQAWAPVPKCGLAFLDAIPAIGSKSTATRSNGPQGQPTVLNTELGGSVSFYFGALP